MVKVILSLFKPVKLLVKAVLFSLNAAQSLIKVIKLLIKAVKPFVKVILFGLNTAQSPVKVIELFVKAVLSAFKACHSVFKLILPVEHFTLVILQSVDIRVYLCDIRMHFFLFFEYLKQDLVCIHTVQPP